MSSSSVTCEIPAHSFGVADKGYTVSVRLGKVLDPYAKLYLQLCGEHEESTKIVLRPSGEAADAFQEGKTYKFSVEMPEIGKVRAF